MSSQKWHFFDFEIFLCFKFPADTVWYTSKKLKITHPNHKLHKP